MNLIRKIFAALLVSLLVGGTAFAQSVTLTAAQAQAVATAIANGTDPKAAIAAATGLNVATITTADLQAAVTAVVAAAPAG